ncbi:hypothetical protein ACP3TB_17225 [Rahnella variigena]|uniref:hypothetical protein n=1 Tax=Rahnella variigena TaxID=574964 RepID=UPI003CF7393E
MEKHAINPEKITKPIQLLSAWLLGMLLVNSTFLFAAKEIQNPSWASSLLVIAAVVNVPVFLISLFLLQTKFRPQMQEDQYYAEYLKYSYTGTKIVMGAGVTSENSVVYQKGTNDLLLSNATRKIANEIGDIDEAKAVNISNIIKDFNFETIYESNKSLRTLSEVYYRKNSWVKVYKKYFNDPGLKQEIKSLTSSGLITFSDKREGQAELTELGLKVIKKSIEDKNDFKSLHSDFWFEDMQDLENQ